MHKSIMLAAALALALLAPSWANATCVSKPCYESETVTIKVKKKVGQHWGLIDDYEIVKKRVKRKKKVPCCAKPQETVQIKEPPPKTVNVPQKIYVVTKPEIHYLPPPRVVVRRSYCCPTGLRIPGVRPCRPGELSYYSAKVGYNPAVSVQPNWASQGQNEQCRGQPKGVPFPCVSPTSGRTVECKCGD